MGYSAVSNTAAWAMVGFMTTSSWRSCLLHGGSDRSRALLGNQRSGTVRADWDDMRFWPEGIWAWCVRPCGVVDQPLFTTGLFLQQRRRSWAAATTIGRHGRGRHFPCGNHGGDHRGWRMSRIGRKALNSGRDGLWGSLMDRTFVITFRLRGVAGDGVTTRRASGGFIWSAAGG